MNAIQRRPRDPLRAVVLDGIRVAGENGIRNLLAEDLREAGSDVELLSLQNLDIAPCQGCFGCWIQTPGECVIPDAGRDVARTVIQSDLVVFLTPVTFGGYSSTLKKAVDRLIPLVSPYFRRVGGEVHHRPRYRRHPCLVGVGLLDRSDPEAEAVFARLVERNAINLWAPAHAAVVLQTDEEPDLQRQGVHDAMGKVGIPR